MNRAYSAEVIDAFDLDATFSTDAQLGIPGDVITTLTIPNPVHPGLSDQPAVDAYFGSIQLLEGSQVIVTTAGTARIPILQINDENGLLQWVCRLNNVPASALSSQSYVQGDDGFLFFGLFTPRPTIPEQFYMRAGWSLVMTLFNGLPGDRYFPRFTFKR